MTDLSAISKRYRLGEGTLTLVLLAVGSGNNTAAKIAASSKLKRQDVGACLLALTNSSPKLAHNSLEELKKALSDEPGPEEVKGYVPFKLTPDGVRIFKELKDTVLTPSK